MNYTKVVFFSENFCKWMLMQSRINLSSYCRWGKGETKVRRRGRNIIGHWAILNVPNITMCAAITQKRVLHRHADFGLYNTAHILTRLDRLHNVVLTAEEQMDAEQMRCIQMSLSTELLWSKTGFISIHISLQHLPLYTPFLNPIEEVFFGMAVEGYGTPCIWHTVPYTRCAIYTMPQRLWLCVWYESIVWFWAQIKWFWGDCLILPEESYGVLWMQLEIWFLWFKFWENWWKLRFQ